MYHTIDRYAEPDWAGERLSATREGMRMEYRGFHYQVVRKISPNGWRWSVQASTAPKHRFPFAPNIDGSKRWPCPEMNETPEHSCLLSNNGSDRYV